MKVMAEYDGLTACWNKEAYFSLTRLEVVCYAPKAKFTRVTREDGDNQREFRFSTGLWRKDAVIYKDKEVADEG